MGKPKHHSVLTLTDVEIEDKSMWNRRAYVEKCSCHRTWCHIQGEKAGSQNWKATEEPAELADGASGICKVTRMAAR